MRPEDTVADKVNSRQALIIAHEETLRPATWQGVPQNRTRVPSLRSVLMSAKQDPASLWTYLELRSGRSSSTLDARRCRTRSEPLALIGGAICNAASRNKLTRDGAKNTTGSGLRNIVPTGGGIERPNGIRAYPRLRPQALVHAPQPMQRSLSIIGRTNPSLPSDMAMAPFGQTAAHAPHPQQCVGDSNSVGTSSFSQQTCRYLPICKPKVAYAEYRRSYRRKKPAQLQGMQWCSECPRRRPTDNRKRTRPELMPRSKPARLDLRQAL